MENLTSSTGAKTNKRNNHQWTPAEDKVLIECCLELVNQGWRADNGFKTGYLTQLQKWMSEKIPNSKIMGDPHIKSRTRTLKAQFRELKEMRGQSGFGWDDANQCVTCDDDVWFSWLKSHKDASGRRNKSFPYFNELAIIFGNDQATGDGAEFAGESVEAMERENSTLEASKTASEAHESMKDTVQDDYLGLDVEVENINEPILISEDTCNDSHGSTKRKKMAVQMQGESIVPSKKGKKKVSAMDKIDDSFSKHMERFYDICDGTKQEIGKVATYFQHLNANVEKRSLLYESIIKLSGLTKEEAVRAIGMISADKGKIESYFLFPDDDAKLIYVKSVLAGVI